MVFASVLFSLVVFNLAAAAIPRRWRLRDDARRLLGWISVAILFESVVASAGAGPRSVASDAIVMLASVCAVGAIVASLVPARRLMWGIAGARASSGGGVVSEDPSERASRRASVQVALCLGAGMAVSLQSGHRYAAIFFSVGLVLAVMKRRLLLGDAGLPEWAFVAAVIACAAVGWFFPA